MNRPLPDSGPFRRFRFPVQLKPFNQRLRHSCNPSKPVIVPTPAANCANPTSANEIKLAGWVHSYRDHGHLVFIDLRDREGVTQLVFDARPLRQERSKKPASCAANGSSAIHGKVDRARRDMVNPKLPTGEIEVRVTKLEVLSESPTPPFTPDEHETVNEERRLQYRYIDLRRDEMQQTLRTRYRVTKIMRDYLGDLGFWEIETPFLTKSTPEGGA